MKFLKTVACLVLALCIILLAICVVDVATNYKEIKFGSRGDAVNSDTLHKISYKLIGRAVVKHGLSKELDFLYDSDYIDKSYVKDMIDEVVPETYEEYAAIEDIVELFR